MPTIIGTSTPVSTRAEAVEHVVGMMSVCAQRDNVPAPDPTTGLRYFRFDEYEVPVHPGLLAEFVEKSRTLGTDPADVLSDLADIRIEIAGDGPVTQEAWDAAPFESRYDACKFSCIAMALGIRQIAFDPASAHDPDNAFASPAMH